MNLVILLTLCLTARFALTAHIDSNGVHTSDSFQRQYAIVQENARRLEQSLNDLNLRDEAAALARDVAALSRDRTQAGIDRVRGSIANLSNLINSNLKFTKDVTQQHIDEMRARGREALTNMQNSIENFKIDAQQKAEYIGNKTVEGARDVKDGAQTGLEYVVGGAMLAGNKTAEGAIAVKDATVDGALYVGNKTAEGVENIKEGVQSLGQKIADTAKGAVEFVLGGAVALKDSVVGSAEYVHDKAANATEYAVNRTAEAGQAVRDKGAEAAQNVKDSVEPYANRVHEGIENYKDAAGQGVDHIKQGLSKTGTGVKEVATGDKRVPDN